MNARTRPDLKQADISALVVSRICHDLISPVGAIGNGVELLALSGKGSGPELDLIAESVARAQARIRFFRIAFGEFSADRRINPAELRSIVDALFLGTRVSMDWRIGSDLSRREAKLCFLLLLCLESALPRGGTITADEQDGGWTLIAAAERLNVDRDLWDGLSTGEARVDPLPKDVHFALAARHSARMGGRIAVDPADTSLSIIRSCA
ncbi:MAG: histidine phosphotransferase [Rhodobacteraceae bacterium]|nr:histidine phosphotransferase [Paracoccaceae bacterium]